MDLGTFKSIVDAVRSSQIQEEQNSNDVLEKIRQCFTQSESDQAKYDIGRLIDDMGIRYMCDQIEVEPYLEVASAIRQSLRDRGTSSQSTSDWRRAVELAVTYAANSYSLPSEQAWRSNVRVNCLSTAISELRKIGYAIELPDRGGFVLAESETNRLSRDIESKASSLGSALAFSIGGAMAGSYSSLTGRFNIGRGGQTVQIDAKPPRPLAYLYQLGLRYFEYSPSAPFPEVVLGEIVNLTTWATALLDLSVESFELMFARETDTIRLLQKSLMYDSVFLLTQAKTAHALEYLEWMMSRAPLLGLSDKQGRTAAQVLAAAAILIRSSEKAKPGDFMRASVNNIAYATNLDFEHAATLLREVFTHTEGANQSLTFPPADNAIDAAFRPLLWSNGSFILQPAPMAARATVNAALQWCRMNWTKGNFDDKAIGPLFEEFIRHKLIKQGVATIHGSYKVPKSKSECDAIVDAELAVVVFELKSKMLRREGRAGDDIVALVDLAQALVRPQAQAMERNAVLLENDSLTLYNDVSSSTIKLGAREVLRLSITRGDLGSIHDRPFLQLFLRTGCGTEFITIDPQRQGEFKALHDWFRKLKTAAERAKEPIFGTPFPFERSWSLSVFQLLLLLERVSDANCFVKELQRNRRIFTPLRDFYSEYEFALTLNP
ncbi:hypothetical protein [Massilia oculi]|uniref:hypothetical protein n=1 Tax=Massilia oculi TaxID=945844 RepID=UPI001AAF084D|nr:hypothetical protein [Massilia oculi]